MYDNFGLLMLNLRQINIISILLRYALAVVCGAIIGIERGKNHHAAGLRTHIIICLASATAMMTNQYIFTFLAPNSDPARLGAQVISGIGFIGVGTIMATGKYQITGITTASGLWASACMGLAIGAGFYECALILCAVLYIVLSVMNKVDEHYFKSIEVIGIYIEYNSQVPLSDIINVLVSNYCHIEKIEYLKSPNERIISISITLSNQSKKNSSDYIVSKLKESSDIYYATIL